MSIDEHPQLSIAAKLKHSAICLMLCVAIATMAVAQPQHRVQSANSATLPQSPLVRDAHFHSVSLNREMVYRIYLPRNYPGSTLRYPVLYLLHGLYGDYQNWDTRTNLAKYAAGLEWIIVMPDADDSWYTNSATKPQDKFEDYIAEDLIAEIDAKYRTIRDRHGRTIAGLSMGGYGALKLALRDPQLFAFAGSLSGALDAAQDLDSKRPEFAAKLLEVFGPPGSPAREKNDIFHLLQSAEAKDLPYLYVACGTEDDFVSVNREFVAHLTQRSVRYEYHETPGDHEWAYWGRAIEPLLSTMEGLFSKGQ